MPIYSKRPDTESVLDKQFAGSELDNIDRAIKRYVVDPMYKFDIKKHWNKLVDRYPLRTTTKLYRGMTFDDKEGLDDFLEFIKSGTLTTDDISSWTPSKEVAMKYATSRPQFISELITDGTVDVNDNSKKYYGVVLSTVVKPNIALNITATKLSDEPELLLTSGSYLVKVEVSD